MSVAKRAALLCVMWGGSAPKVTSRDQDTAFVTEVEAKSRRFRGSSALPSDDETIAEAPAVLDSSKVEKDGAVEDSAESPPHAHPHSHEERLRPRHAAHEADLYRGAQQRSTRTMKRAKVNRTRREAASRGSVARSRAHASASTRGARACARVRVRNKYFDVDVIFVSDIWSCRSVCVCWNIRVSCLNVHD